MSKSPKLSRVQVSQIIKAQVTQSSSHSKLKSLKAQVTQSPSCQNCQKAELPPSKQVFQYTSFPIIWLSHGQEQLCPSGSPMAKTFIPKLPQVKNNNGSPMAKNIYGPPMAKNIYGPQMAKNVYGPSMAKKYLWP